MDKQVYPLDLNPKTSNIEVLLKGKLDSPL